jgi:tetratricopeptide (TPR) repeat protein
MTPKRFRIALSFAGEKRDFVHQVAERLAARFGQDKILYDKFHEAEFANPDLAFNLPTFYKSDSELIVAVFCSDYEHKEWCGLEWRAIFALIKGGGAKQVLLTRFGLGDGKGLHGLGGFVDLDDKPPDYATIRILERLALNEGRERDFYKTASAGTEVRPGANIRNNLPRLDPFFGRVQELAQIREALDPESRTWGALIDGPGGMGKTSLAVRAAYDCPPGQFDRIVFVTIKDRELDDDGERQLGNLLIPGFLEMLNEVARELEVPEFWKVPEHERIRALLDVLRGKRVLLVLDNLESIEKSDRDLLLTFVKRLPSGCKAILTSRRRIGSSADTLILEQLDEAAALELLAELAQRNRLLARTSDAERRQLYERTAGKPLLLRWLAGQLGRGSCRTIADAFRFLASCPPGNDPLEFIFGDLAQEFTPDEERVLVALTYFTLPVKVEHLALVAGLEAVPTETALDSLANRSLVSPNQEETAFTLVPLVAEFLRKHRPEVVAETGNRLEKRALALIVENGYEQHDRYEVLDAAWPTLAPALPLFLAGPNDRLQTVSDALDYFLDFTGRWDEWLSLSQQAEAKAVAAADLENAGWRAHQAGWVHSLREQADQVLACADRARSHWEAAKLGSIERAHATSLRGVGYELQKDYPAAIAAFREALGLYKSLSTESSNVASTLNDLATAKRLSGDLEAAESDFQEALQIAQAVDDSEGVAIFTGNLANLALVCKDWSRAEALAREALPLAELLGRKELIAEDCRWLAEALVRQGRAAEALPYAHRSVAIYTELRSPRLAAAEEILRECEG